MYFEYSTVLSASMLTFYWARTGVAANRVTNRAPILGFIIVSLAYCSHLCALGTARISSLTATKNSLSGSARQSLFNCSANTTTSAA